MSSAATSGVPFGRFTATSSSSIAGRRRGAATSITGGVMRGRARRCHGRALEAVEPLDDGAPFGELAIDVDEERQRALHAVEGGRGLHQAAELDRAGEIGRADHDKGKHVGPARSPR